MKEDKSAQGEEKRKETTQKGRWSRGVDGALRYRGVCPFNRAVCKLINALTPVKARQKGV